MPNELLASRRALLGWYRRHRRSLPWRATRDPYRIWVSEVMLQQTQVVTVRPYYRAFLRRFPTLRSLAAASTEDVLAAWSGLGYYRRARHLLEAARIVVREHRGRVPHDLEAFHRLPGVGRYTAGAVLSIAFDKPLPALDGNVARVLSRQLALRDPVKSARGGARLWRLAASLVPMRQPGDWNQALMELGARVCTPKSPGCGSCPIRGSCRARALGTPEGFPVAVSRRAPERLRRAVAWIERGGRVLLVRRTGSLLAGLWEPPGVDLAGDQSAHTALARAIGALGIAARLTPTGVTLRHVITHRRIEVELWRAEISAVPRSRAFRYESVERPRVALAALTRKARAALRSRIPATRAAC